MAILNVDDSHPGKNNNTYDPQYLLGTIPVAGSVSSPYDLSAWTQFALQTPSGGTLLGGTALNILASPTLQGTYLPVVGTTGTVVASVQIGSTGGQIITNITALTPLRFVAFAAGGTQSAAQVLTLFVK